MRRAAAAFALLLTAGQPGPAQGPEAVASAPVPLAKRFAEWLAEVGPIMTTAEQELFTALKKDYQREAFIRRFWQVRDPFPETGRNEFRERWEDRVQFARAHLGGFEDDRARIFVVHGPPARLVEVKCTTTRKPAEVWLYLGSEQVDFRFVLVFLRGRGGLGPARLWRPGVSGSLDPLISSARSCINGYLLGDVVNEIRRGTLDYDVILDRVLVKPLPRSTEWVSTFASFTTDLPVNAALFPARSSVEFLGRHQLRTVVQGVLEVPLDEVTVADFGGYQSYNFVLTGEVVLEDDLFESFRYKFGFAATDIVGQSSIPMAFQRYLRPGEYQLIIKLEDLNSGRFFRSEGDLVVPTLTDAFELPPPTDAESAQIFAEATAAVELGETGIKVVPPARDLQTGLVRIDTLVSGDDIDRVVFFLDGKPIVTKNRAPFNVELDLGAFPTLHALRVEALDVEEQLVASDEVLLNAGGHRFSIRLIEPRRGGSYRSSLRARAEVQVPEDRALDRVELFLNERLVATLYQEPWVQPIQVPDRGGASYLRAVAYLSDGNSTEDLVFVNAPEHFEQVEVQFVELYASVADRSGRPLGGLQADDFTVVEDGVKQRLARFELVQDLPIHVGVLIDNSASMHRSMETTRRAALSFFEQAIQPKDRAAVVTFNRFPRLAVKLTSDLRLLGGGLAGLTAEGQTALYDSLMFTLYYFAGITGQRAVLLLSDGKDEVSRFSFDETLEYARRAGVTIYAIGLGITEGEARRQLATMADETGGRSYFIGSVDELASIYDIITRELRSQYLLAYQSSNTKQDNRFRTVEVKVDRPQAVVKTMSGYYP